MQACSRPHKKVPQATAQWLHQTHFLRTLVLAFSGNSLVGFISDGLPLMVHESPCSVMRKRLSEWDPPWNIRDWIIFKVNYVLCPKLTRLVTNILKMFTWLHVYLLIKIKILSNDDILKFVIMLNWACFYRYLNFVSMIINK